MESLIRFDVYNENESECTLVNDIKRYEPLMFTSHIDQANHHSLSALLNCYLREIVMPNNELLIERINNTIKITFPVGTYKVTFLTDKVSLSGFYNICSPIIANDGKNFLPLDYISLLTVINHKLSNEYNLPLNLEIMLQAKNSLENMSEYIKHSKAIDKINFISNEQSLTFGHEFHPTPKARYGMDGEDLLKLSPEVNAEFKLHYFKVPINLLCCYVGNIKIIPPGLLVFHDQYVEYPIHPWQAKFILKQKPLRDILDSLGIKSIGERGSDVIPSSSVRTLFNTSFDYLYKYSLHMRLTNCLRKNSHYELENAVKLSDIINSRNLTVDHPNVTILYEPTAYTVDIQSNDDKTNIVFKELFGLILRENIPLSHQNNSSVALNLFSRKLNANPVIKEIINKYSHSKNISYEQSASCWFQSYAKILFNFIFDSYAFHGIIFEPHLQNIIIHLEDHLPRHIYIRDLEGTKVCDTYYLNEEKVCGNNSAIYYDSEKSFRRITYCLIFNNFATSIHYLSDKNSTLEVDLWQQLYDIIKSYKTDRNFNGVINDQLDNLLNATHLPCKANLLTRYLKSADKNAAYIDFPNPLYALTGGVRT